MPVASEGPINPDPIKTSEPCAILGQPFQRSLTFWSQACSYTTVELSIYGQTALEPHLMLANDNFLD